MVFLARRFCCASTANCGNSEILELPRSKSGPAILERTAVLWPPWATFLMFSRLARLMRGCSTPGRSRQIRATPTFFVAMCALCVSGQACRPGPAHHCFWTIPMKGRAFRVRNAARARFGAARRTAGPRETAEALPSAWTFWDQTTIEFARSRRPRPIGARWRALWLETS